MTKRDISLREHLSRAGKASAAKLTPEQRSERARKAVEARERKRAIRRKAIVGQWIEQPSGTTTLHHSGA